MEIRRGKTYGMDLEAVQGGEGSGGRLGSRGGASFREVVTRMDVWQESKNTITSFINQGWKERVFIDDEKEQIRILAETSRDVAELRRT